MDSPTLRGKLAAVEVQMKAKLEEARATFRQSGDKGTSVEEAFRAFLREYLPRRLAVGHGEIIDSRDGRSAQTDIVIANEDHPFTFTPDLPGLFFIEGVSAAGEVKSVLTSKHLNLALQNSRQFKQLEMLTFNTLFMGGDAAEERRYFEKPPWFLVAFTSQLSLEAIRTRIIKFVTQSSVEPNRLVDAVFILDVGSVINFGDGQGPLQYRLPDGTPLGGWQISHSNEVLFDLLGWLSVVMQRIIRFEAILTRYMVSHDR